MLWHTVPGKGTSTILGCSSHGKKGLSKISQVSLTTRFFFSYAEKHTRYHHFSSLRGKVGCPLTHILGEIHGHECPSFLPLLGASFFLSSPYFQHQQHLGDRSAKHGGFLHAHEILTGLLEALLNLWAYSLQDEVGSHQCSGYFPQTKHRVTGTSFWDSVIKKKGLKQHFLRIFFG